MEKILFNNWSWCEVEVDNSLKELSKNFFESYDIIKREALDLINEAYKEALYFICYKDRHYLYNLVSIVNRYNEICWSMGEEKVSIIDIMKYITNHKATKWYYLKEER